MSEQSWTKEPWSHHGYFRLFLNGVWVGNAYEDEDLAKSMINALNAMAKTPDPEAFMSAHDKLVEASEKIVNGGLAFWDVEKLDTLDEALAAVKEANGANTTKASR